MKALVVLLLAVLLGMHTLRAVEEDIGGMFGGPPSDLVRDIRYYEYRPISQNKGVQEAKKDLMDFLGTGMFVAGVESVLPFAEVSEHTGDGVTSADALKISFRFLERRVVVYSNGKFCLVEVPILPDASNEEIQSIIGALISKGADLNWMKASNGSYFVDPDKSRPAAPIKAGEKEWRLTKPVSVLRCKDALIFGALLAGERGNVEKKTGSWVPVTRLDYSTDWFFKLEAGSHEALRNPAGHAARVKELDQRVLNWLSEHGDKH